MLKAVSPRYLQILLELSRAGTAAAAARRLGVTASAVSHAVAELEKQLGGPLFADRRRSLLNDKGRALVERLAPAFQSIEMAVSDFRAAHASIRLSTLSSFATMWLIPRLPRLRRQLPEVDILISTDTRPVDLTSEPYDCVIRWAGPQADWRGLQHHLLFKERLIRVASPRVSRQSPLPRLSARSRPGDWALFDKDEASGAATMFETRAQMIEAAVAGLGAAVIDRHLVAAALSAGHLVQLGPETVERPEGYVFAARPAALESLSLRKFRNWLLEEITPAATA